MVPIKTLLQEILLAPLPTTERGKQTVIDVDPANKSRIIYAHGKCVYLVNLEDNTANFAYTEHSHQCTVARFSPSGYYVASADVSGMVRVWDATQPSHLLKAEFQVLGGPIRDLCWDSENKHIIAVGEGREKFAHAFMFDTGSSVGELIGHTKTINSVAIRPCRPLRAVTASDDFTVNFYTGTPYKFSKSLKDHTRFVQCVRYAPDGSKFATCGSDGKIFVYNGETADLMFELKDSKVGVSAHSSGILALCWSPDSTKLVSSSMDQLTKCWDVSKETVIFESAVKFSQTCSQDNQVVGNVWSKSGILILGLTGSYALIDESNGSVKQLFEGHQKGLSALMVTSNDELVSASYDGAILRWSKDLKSGNLLTKDQTICPSNQVDGLFEFNGDILALSCLDSRGYQLTSKGDFEVVSWLTGKQACALRDGSVACIQDNKVVLFKGGRKTAELSFLAKPTSIASNGEFVAVGLEDKCIHFLKDSLVPMSEKKLEANFGSISALSFSPDGKSLAAGDEQRRIKVYSVETVEPIKSNWCFHSARISALAWLKGASEGLLVSGSLDNTLMVWSPLSPIKPVLTIPNAHSGPIVGIAALCDGRFVSTSQDGSLKIWSLSSE